MSTSKVLELQSLASDNTVDVVDVLFLAKAISFKLNLNDLAEWIEYELTGYPQGVELPDYRIAKGNIRYWHQYQRVWKTPNYSSLSTDVIDYFQTFSFNSSIAAISTLTDEESQELYMSMAPHLIAEMFASKEKPSDVRWFFSSSVAKLIVTTVRSKILDWSLELESKGILGEGLLFTQREKDIAPMTINNNFNGVFNNNGVFANQARDINQQNTINAGDMSSLLSKLKEHGVDDTDVQELKDVIEQSPAPKTKEEVEKGFGTWIGKMTGKAFTGAISIAGSTAPVVLANAICQYYGIAV
ncbi:abortive phage resistance protein [Pantoea sp. PSNIH1]|nr:abortive phage resistance protein [Pantoea sp. PSNIH1]